MTTRENFTHEYELIKNFHRCGAGGIEVSSELTELVDRTLADLFDLLPQEFRESCTAVALGGYGRYEMAPFSDVDVMLLFENEQTKKLHSDSAQKFLHSLWNLGFDVGHSVRTIKDCLNLYQTDVDVWASVLESRYVCGSIPLIKNYAEQMITTIGRKQDLQFIASVIAGVDERHKKYEHAVKLLEPNLKNSSGGLRDLHSLVWIYRASDIKYFDEPVFQTQQSGTLQLFEAFQREGIIPNEEYRELVQAFNFLLRIRHEMHFTAGSQQDILEFAKQLQIARNLGYNNSDPVRAVEQCMREYFLHARAVYRLNRRLINQFRKSASASFWSRRKEEVLDELYMIRDEQLHIRNTAMEITTPAQILKAFYWCALRGIELSPPLTALFDMLSRDAKIFKQSKAVDEQTAAAFLEILRLPENAAEAFHMMNECDILGKIFPEWGALVAFFQHSMYHYYTTDEHTLIALEHTEKLLHSKSILGETYRNLPKKEILSLAILFHDIAKPSGIPEHEIRGVDVWKSVQQRFGFVDEYNDVSFLIRNHLIMEQIAFRRNTNDKKTIEEFASYFSRPEQLDLLFVLTYADLSAVNKSVWTSWKEMLLQELFLKTRKLLTQQSPQEEEDFSSPFTKEELAVFETSVRALETVEVLFTHESAHSVVTIITRDAGFLLSTLCGVLSANDASIFDAKIFTRADGIVIDAFRVVDAATKLPLTKNQETAIRRDLENVLSHKESLEKLFEQHHRRWKRRAKPLMHPNIKVDASFHQAHRHTIIDVYAPDMVGFLYKITQTLSKAGLQIDFAKLATRGDGIVDSFYVKNSDGTRIADSQQEHLRERILHTIQQLMNVQLGK